MQILIDADSSENAGEPLLDRVRDTVGAALHHYGFHISRAVVHLSHPQAGGDDAPQQRCRIEVRLRGCQPLSVEHAARSIEMAVDGALYRLTRVIDGAREGALGQSAEGSGQRSGSDGFGAAT